MIIFFLKFCIVHEDQHKFLHFLQLMLTCSFQKYTILQYKKGDIRVGMRTQNQPRSNGICGIEVEILKEADLAGISNVSCSPVVAGGNKVRPSVH